MQFAIKSLSIVFITATLIACGGGGGSSSAVSSSSGPQEPTFSENIIVTASLGRISNASVTVYDASFSSILGSGELSSNGRANVAISYNKIEPIIVVVTAGESSSYFDESAGELTLAQGTTLHAMVEDPRHTAVTPLTELAWQIAQSQNLLPLNSDRVKRLNQSVGNIFTGGIMNVSRAPAVLSEMPSPASMSASPDNLYASILGALATMGEGEAEPMMAMLDALSYDINNHFSGLFPENITAPYESHTFAGAFRNALESWVSTYGTSEAQQAIFALPLPSTLFDSHAGRAAEDRIQDKSWLSRETAVAYSRDGDEEWTDFPVGQALSSVRFGNVMGLIENNEVSLFPATAPTDTSAFIAGWNVNLNNAEYSNQVSDPETHAIRVAVPTGDDNLKRYYLFIRREDADLDSFILYEDDLTTARKPDRIAHVLNHASSDYIRDFLEGDLFDDLHAMAQSGTTLTIIRGDDEAKLCTTPGIGTGNASYPKLVGLIHSESEQEVQSLEPQRMRFAKINGLADSPYEQQREILFSDEMLIRQNMDTGRIDFITFSFGGGDISQWATNYQPLIDENCP